jgi:hypothetical protein
METGDKQVAEDIGNCQKKLSVSRMTMNSTRMEEWVGVRIERNTTRDRRFNQ